MEGILCPVVFGGTLNGICFYWQMSFFESVGIFWSGVTEVSSGKELGLMQEVWSDRGDK